MVARFRELGMTLAPTFVPFTPWTTLESYCELLDVIARENLTENVAPIQLAIRLLIPAGSLLLELPDVRALVEPFDGRALMFPWKHPDARLDALSANLSRLVEAGEKQKKSRTEIFHDIWRAAHAAAGKHAVLRAEGAGARSAPVPFLDEPWYCCAEPTQEQFVTIGSARAGVSGADRFV